MFQVREPVAELLRIEDGYGRLCAGTGPWASEAPNEEPIEGS